MKFIIYIIILIFLIIPISYAECENCIMKKGSVVSDKIEYIILFDFLSEINDKELIKYMFDIRRIGITLKDIKVKLLIIMTDEKNKISDIAEVEIKTKKQNIKVWVFYYNIICNGEEDDKTKRRTLKGQEKEGKDVEKRTKRSYIKI